MNGGPNTRRQKVGYGFSCHEGSNQFLPVSIPFLATTTKMVIDSFWDAISKNILLIWLLFYLSICYNSLGSKIVSFVQFYFTSIEAVQTIIRDGDLPGRPLPLSHSSWALKLYRKTTCLYNRWNGNSFKPNCLSLGEFNDLLNCRVLTAITELSFNRGLHLC